jgi:hypothetical protein
VLSDTRNTTKHTYTHKEKGGETEEETETTDTSYTHPPHNPSCTAGIGATSENSSADDPPKGEDTFRAAASSPHGDPGHGDMCRDCETEPCAAGKARCAECHAIHVRVMEGYE